MIKHERAKQFVFLSSYGRMFLCRISGGQQCKLACIAQVGIRQFAKYGFGSVADGTRCDDYDENSGICISGKCQVSYVEMPFMLPSSNFSNTFLRILIRVSWLRWRVLYRKKNRTKIEESRENPLQQERNRGAKQLKSTSSVPEFSLILPSGSDVETLNATARQSTDPTLLLVGTLTAPIKKTNSTKKSFDICYLQLLDYILSRKFRFSVSFLSPTSH